MVVHPFSVELALKTMCRGLDLLILVFVLKTGIPWEDLPQEMGCGSGMTCWRRLRDWQEAGVWENLHHVILQNLHDTKKIDWSRACIDGSVIQAKRGANTQDPTP